MKYPIYWNGLMIGFTQWRHDGYRILDAKENPIGRKRFDKRRDAVDELIEKTIERIQYEIPG